MYLFPMLARREKGKGGGGGGNFQVVVSRAAILSSFNTNTVKLTDAMRSKRSRPMSIWERLWVISPMCLHQRSAGQA